MSIINVIHIIKGVLSKIEYCDYGEINEWCFSTTHPLTDVLF